jgi:hypothetical protein
VGLTKDQCKKGGWRALGFRNQGQCVSFVQANSNADKEEKLTSTLAGYVRPETSAGNTLLAMVVGLGLFTLGLALPIRRRIQ